MVEKLDDPDIDMNFPMLAARGMLQEIKKNFLLDPEDEAGPFKAGFDVNVKDAAGATAAHHACRAGESKTLKFLVDHGVDLEAPSYGGMRAVHHSANCMKENCLRICLEAGAAANSLDDYGSTALHWACARGVLANCSYLIDHGGDCKLGNAAGVTPLHKAAGNGHLPVVKELLHGHEVELEAKDNQQNTPLHAAAKAHFFGIYDFLVEKGADPEARNSQGLTPAECRKKAEQIHS
eukprot:g1801.t1